MKIRLAFGSLAVVLVLVTDAVHAQQLPADFPRWPPPVMADRVPSGLAGAGVPDTGRIVVGYRQWRGAATGAGVGGLVGAFLGLAFAADSRCDDCVDEPSQGEAALIVGLIGAGAGGVIGFLVGLATPEYGPSQ